MDVRRRAICLLVALCAVVGCRQNQAANRELIEREMRLQEDRIYELEGKLQDAQRELERVRGGSGASSAFGERRSLVDPSCPIEISTSPAVGPSVGSSNGGSTTQVSPGSSSGTTAPRSSNDVPRVPDTAPPKIELPPGVEAAPPFPGAPIMSPPDGQKPEGLPSRGTNAPTTSPSPAATTPAPAPPFKPMSSPRFRPPGTAGRLSNNNSSNGGVSSGGTLPIEPAAPVVGEPPVVAAADTSVKNITLNRRSGGWNSDGKSGDEGVIVIVEPRNARGDLMPAAGEMSIVLIDPALEGDAGRYARWDFAADDAAALYRSPAAGGTGGLHLELAWPEAPPQHARLKLFARLATSDGRRLETEKDIVVDIGGGLTSRSWPMPSPATGGYVEAGGAVSVGTNEPTTNAPAMYWNGPESGTSVGPALLPAGNAPPHFGAGGIATPFWRRAR